MIPKALSLDKMVIVALFGVPSVTPLEELWEEIVLNGLIKSRQISHIYISVA